ncbi:hypothetical protein Ccrd_010586 [Cynara cardunculus var. scolymus]|uniref:Uncharacterized protein n=1 Tax=Cynara cardunculus var. scolymus TaxID=59895 RepID=A0A118K6P9_CYNCS|nr:hypothetical protein Ccrd_010586 [Cynara cardunculus var. scolymus]
MSSNILRRVYQRSSSILTRYQPISTLFVSQFFTSSDKPQNHASGLELLSNNASGVSSIWYKRLNFSCGSTRLLFSTQAAVEPSTSDGLTVDGIIANEWTILDENESDWKSHASAIAQSIGLIKKRLQESRSEIMQSVEKK